MHDGIEREGLAMMTSFFSLPFLSCSVGGVQCIRIDLKHLQFINVRQTSEKPKCSAGEASPSGTWILQRIGGGGGSAFTLFLQGKAVGCFPPMPSPRV